MGGHRFLNRVVGHNSRIDGYDHRSTMDVHKSVKPSWIRKSQENHRKIIGNNMVIIMAIFGHFMVKLYLNNRFNGLIDFVRFGLV